MSVRALDLQVLIPKAPEVQKAKLLEQAVPQNNELINMNKDKKIVENRLNQVNAKERPDIIRINDERERERERQEHRKERDNKREQLLEERKLEAEKSRKKQSSNANAKNAKKQENKIDIRI